MKKLRWLDAWRKRNEKPHYLEAYKLPQVGLWSVPIAANDNEKEPDAVSKYRRFLLKKGYSMLGSGCFSSVWNHPKSNRVLKLCHNPDAWIDYVIWAAENKWAGKFAPKVYSFKYHKQGHFYVAVMEKMEYDLWHTDESDDTRLAQILWDHKMRTKNDKAELMCDLIFPGYVRFGLEMKKRFEGKRLDLHHGNIMVRQDGSICITDPVCHPIETKVTRLRAADFARAA